MNIAFKPHAGEAVLIDALDGAEGWRADLRRALETGGLPNKRAEAWKWTDLRQALAGLETARDALVFTPSRPADTAGPVAHAPTIFLPRLAAALGGDALTFRLRDGETLELSARAAAGAGHRIFLLEVPENVSATVRESWAAGEGGFCNIAILYRLAPGAHLERIVETGEGEGVIAVTAAVEMSERSKLTQFTLTEGAKLCRLESHVSNPGGGAETILDAAYLLAPGRHADLTSAVTHTGPGGRFSQLCKGAAAARAHGVFRGRILVERAAQKTEARLTHRALLLDSKAEIDAKPELEIYADDVQCAHGNAIGSLDGTALFYLRQRGLPEAVARALLIESFLAEPLQTVSDEALRAAMAGTLHRTLESLS